MIAYDVHQHGAFLYSANTSRQCHNHQTDGNDYHETGWREKMIVHKNAEIIENRRNCRPNSHQQESSQL